MTTSTTVSSVWNSSSTCRHRSSCLARSVVSSSRRAGGALGPESVQLGRDLQRAVSPARSRGAPQQLHDSGDSEPAGARRLAGREEAGDLHPDTEDGATAFDELHPRTLPDLPRPQG